MKKLYSVKIEIETYFVADEKEFQKRGLEFLSEECGNSNNVFASISPTHIKIQEVASSSDISEDWKNGKYLIWGTSDELTAQEWLLRAFL